MCCSVAAVQGSVVGCRGLQLFLQRSQFVLGKLHCAQVDDTGFIHISQQVKAQVRVQRGVDAHRRRVSFPTACPPSGAVGTRVIQRSGPDPQLALLPGSIFEAFFKYCSLLKTETSTGFVPRTRGTGGDPKNPRSPNLLQPNNFRTSAE